jgi:protein-S-isoprenylcysteine O-methyltransferase Ste14
VVDMLQERIGEEHPFCDSGQYLFILSYLIVWMSDSFWLHYSTFLIGSFHWLLRGSLTLICIIVGVYFAQGAHELVFDEAHSNPQVIDWGVYGIVRHPMYLGVLLILLGLIFWTFSLTSMSIWLGFFFFYDRMASYEEEDLLRLFGKAYSEYQKKVGKWVPRRGVKQVEAVSPQDPGGRIG